MTSNWSTQWVSKYTGGYHKYVGNFMPQHVMRDSCVYAPFSSYIEAEQECARLNYQVLCRGQYRKLA
jgi:hypothetical protein